MLYNPISATRLQIYLRGEGHFLTALQLPPHASPNRALHPPAHLPAVLRLKCHTFPSGNT